MPKCEIRKSSAPVGGERNTRQSYTKIYDTHMVHRGAHALSHPRWHAARALLPYWPQADTAAAVLSAYSGWIAIPSRGLTRTHYTLD